MDAPPCPGGGRVAAALRPGRAPLAHGGGRNRGALLVDISRPPTCVRTTDDMRTVFELMRAEGLSELPVVDESDRVLGLIDEVDIAQMYLDANNDGQAH